MIALDWNIAGVAAATVISEALCAGALTLFMARQRDETRLRLALVLYHCELSVNELAALMSMGQSRISRHLKILTEAGLLHSRRDGLWAFYSANFIYNL